MPEINSPGMELFGREIALDVYAAAAFSKNDRHGVCVVGSENRIEFHRNPGTTAKSFFFIDNKSPGLYIHGKRNSMKLEHAYFANNKIGALLNQKYDQRSNLFSHTKLGKILKARDAWKAKFKSDHSGIFSHSSKFMDDGVWHGAPIRDSQRGLIFKRELTRFEIVDTDFFRNVGGGLRLFLLFFPKADKPGI